MQKRIHTIKILHGRHLTLCVAFACVISLLTGCNKSADSPELLDIYDYVSSDPQKALGALDSVDYRSLSDANRHFYDFLSIKAKDKAYIDHTSDSLILDVINYYSAKGSPDMYAETLYYGGRVYSDLGDYPTSLKFFQKALDLLPYEPKNLDMRANIVSQTGRLLDKLRLYDEAIKYIKESIDIDEQLNDTINRIYDLQSLGYIYLRAEKYDLAEQTIMKALVLDEMQPEYLKAKSRMILAAIQYELGNIDSALILIRNTPELVKQNLTRNHALAHAARIYRDAGIPDTAYMYAHEIINSPNPGPQEIAYHVLLSPELRNLSNQDTLCEYLYRYVSLLENYYEEDKIQFAINQQNLYNYDIHEREKIKALKANEKLKYWIAASVLLLFIMAIIILYLKNRSKARIIELHEAIEKIQRLKAQLDKAKSDSLSNKKIDALPNPAESVNTQGIESQEERPTTHEANAKKESFLREQIRKEILEMYEKSKDNDIISEIILQSDVYKILKEKIARKEMINEDDRLWYDIEQTILKCSPQFMDNLNLLAMGRLSRNELHTVFLIKCGLKPSSEMTILLGRSQGAIVSRRQAICNKVLGEKMNVKIFDAIIRQL